MLCSACGKTIMAFPAKQIRCPACGAMNAYEVERATAAPAESPYRAAAPAPAPSTPLLCPRCRLELARGARGATCGRCRGTFVDHAELRAALVAADAARSSAPFQLRKRCDPDVRSFPCPACRQAMEREALGTRSGIFVDACAAHGSWFDAGELDDAIEYVRSVGLAAARERATSPAPRSSPLAASEPSFETTTPEALAARLAASLLAEDAREQAAWGSVDAVSRRLGLRRGLSVGDLLELLFPG
ncbi:MAG: zf-TFIIB domain-containing protein [Polyangiaceae bacterium]|nr:zf-TFIIB domain-containing protein [Polyangiaceae bacterium]